MADHFHLLSLITGRESIEEVASNLGVPSDLIKEQLREFGIDLLTIGAEELHATNSNNTMTYLGHSSTSSASSASSASSTSSASSASSASGPGVVSSDQLPSDNSSVSASVWISSSIQPTGTVNWSRLPLSMTDDNLISNFFNSNSLAHSDIDDFNRPVPVPLPLNCLNKNTQLAYIQTVPEEESPVICSICLDSIDPGAIQRILLCKHRYHHKCIDTWFEENCHCPVCRYDLRKGNEPTDRLQDYNDDDDTIEDLPPLSRAYPEASEARRQQHPRRSTIDGSMGWRRLSRRHSR